MLKNEKILCRGRDLIPRDLSSLCRGPEMIMSGHRYIKLGHRDSYVGAPV